MSRIVRPETIFSDLNSLDDRITRLERSIVTRYVPTWLPLTLVSDWSVYSAVQYPVGYTIGPFGVIRLRGIVRKATTWSTAWPGELITTLPAGSRPSSELVMCSIVSDTISRMAIFSSGEVRLVSAPVWSSTNFVSLDNVWFWPEN